MCFSVWFFSVHTRCRKRKPSSAVNMMKKCALFEKKFSLLFEGKFSRINAKTRNINEEKKGIILICFCVPSLLWYLALVFVFSFWIYYTRIKVLYTRYAINSFFFLPWIRLYSCDFTFDRLETTFVIGPLDLIIIGKKGLELACFCIYLLNHKFSFPQTLAITPIKQSRGECYVK